MAPAESQQKKKGSNATSSTGSSSRMKSSVHAKKKLVKIDVFVQTDWLGECKTVTVVEDITIGELKKNLCTQHGFLPDLHWLLGAEGVPLDDVLSLPDCGIEKNTTLQLSKRFDRGLSSPRKRKPIYLEEEEEEEDEESVQSTLASEEDLEKAVRTSLKKALTKGGLHARELHSPKQHHRDVARKRAQDKALRLADVHNKEADPSNQDLATLVSGYAQQLFPFPSMFLNCTPEVAKRPPSWGGA